MSVRNKGTDLTEEKKKIEWKEKKRSFKMFTLGVFAFPSLSADDFSMIEKPNQLRMANAQTETTNGLTNLPIKDDISLP